MAIKIAPVRRVTSASNAVTTPLKSATTLVPPKRNVRKPTGKAKEAVTIRLSKECVQFYQDKWPDDWRSEMQSQIEALASNNAS